MEKPYHPCYTDMNPAAESLRYISRKVLWRKVTLIYDWLDPDRNVESWFRRVPYRLKRGGKEGSWVVRYFEFRAGASPVSQMGFIGDLWISWDPVDPSVWFKVEETKWVRWGGCLSSVYERMDAKHPFLDKAYLWFDQRNYFFQRLPEGEPAFRWDQLHRIRGVAPTNRIVDPPDCQTPPKMIPANPVFLPSVKGIVRAMCPDMPSVPPRVSTEGTSESALGVKAPQGPFFAEDLDIGDDVKIDWDWWGSSASDVDEETTEIGNSQPHHLNLPPTHPPPVTPIKQPLYHPYKLDSSPTSPFQKFKPPRRYTQSTFGSATASPTRGSYNTPSLSFVSTSSTAVNSPTTVVYTSDEEPVSPRKRGSLSRRKNILPPQQTLRGVVDTLREDGHDQSGIWALPSLGISESRGDSVTETSVPVLKLRAETSRKIRRLLRQDGIVQRSVLVLNIHDPNDDGGTR